jgi:hypothetical protein
MIQMIHFFSPLLYAFTQAPLFSQQNTTLFSLQSPSFLATELQPACSFLKSITSSSAQIQTSVLHATSFPLPPNLASPILSPLPLLHQASPGPAHPTPSLQTGLPDSVQHSPAHALLQLHVQTLLATSISPVSGFRATGDVGTLRGAVLNS